MIKKRILIVANKNLMKESHQDLQSETGLATVAAGSVDTGIKLALQFGPEIESSIQTVEKADAIPLSAGEVDVETSRE